MSARSAASGGATGLDASGGAAGLRDDSEGRESLFRRHPWATAVAAGFVAVILVSGLTAWIVTTAVTASLTASSLSEMPMGSSAAALAGTGAANGVAATPGRSVIRATITSMNGTSWTVLTKKGETVTIVLDSATLFGTKAMPQTAGSFALGNSVLIVATKNSSGIEKATRVITQP